MAYEYGRPNIDLGTGLLGALGSGLGAGVDSYQAARKQSADEDAKKKGLLIAAAEHGFNLDPDGNLTETEVHKAERDAKSRLIDSEIKKNLAEAQFKSNKGGILGQLTPAEKAADMAYGKEYTDFTSKGINSGSTIEKIEKLADKMATEGSKNDETLAFNQGGGLAAMAPDFLKSRNMIMERDQARNFANTTLKELFGGQLSDAEREAAAREYYNEALPREQNVEIMRQKLAEIKRAYEAKRAKADYYEKTGTLKGYKGLLTDDEIMSKIKSGPTPLERAAGDTNEGATAVNKKTGQRIIFKGGKWQPM